MMGITYSQNSVPFWNIFECFLFQSDDPKYNAVSIPGPKITNGTSNEADVRVGEDESDINNVLQQEHE